ncbi:hypothetical protein CSA57_07160 [candidate division KSB3 bacterium]|nr:MAG: hypothetical protein CSA57_07160 [candidate division KSB3 bacterium]
MDKKGCVLWINAIRKSFRECFRPVRLFSTSTRIGSNGEFRSLSDEESVKIIDVYQQCTPREKHLIAGVMRESAQTTSNNKRGCRDESISAGRI